MAPWKYNLFCQSFTFQDITPKQKLDSGSDLVSRRSICRGATFWEVHAHFYKPLLLQATSGKV